MSSILPDSLAALGAGEPEDILGPSVEEAFPDWEDSVESEPLEYPWWAYLLPLGPIGMAVAPLGYIWSEVIDEQGQVTQVLREVGETVATTSSELWTAAGETAESIGDWLWGGLGTVWESFKWVLLALLVIVVLVALVVLR